MRAIDLQCMAPMPWARLQDWQVDEFSQYFKKDLEMGKSEEEFAQTLRKADVKAMIVLPATAVIRDDVAKLRAINDRAAQFKKDHSDVVIGFWSSVSPFLGYKGLRELERCIQDLGFVGMYYAAAANDGLPANDKLLYHHCGLLSEASVPLRINMGMTAYGAGQPGGRGFRLSSERPFPVIDDICAEFPNLTVISAHPTWPWTDEILAILLHKGNAYGENHGWAPRYVPEQVKKEINSRLQDKYMYGSGWPEVTYERSFGEWEQAGLKPEAAEKMFIKNAVKVFKLKF